MERKSSTTHTEKKNAKRQSSINAMVNPNPYSITTTDHTTHHIRSHHISSDHIRSRLITSHHISSDHISSQHNPTHITTHWRCTMGDSRQSMVMFRWFGLVNTFEHIRLGGRTADSPCINNTIVSGQCSAVQCSAVSGQCSAVQCSQTQQSKANDCFVRVRGTGTVTGCMPLAVRLGRRRRGHWPVSPRWRSGRSARGSNAN